MTVWLAQSAVAPGLSDRQRQHHKRRPEDVASTWPIGDGVMLAVADGLGSSTRGAEAAALAVALATAGTISMTFDVDHDLARARAHLHRAFLDVRAEFLRQVERKPDPHQWKTTLALAAVGSTTVAVAYVGDPILALEAAGLPGDPDGGGRLHLAVHPLRTSAVDAATGTLHDPEGHVATRVVPLPGVTGVLLSTDGLERFIVPRPGPVRTARYTDDILTRAVQFTREQNATDLHYLLNAPAVLERKGDDIGVAIAAR
jgi:hypothetical protein